MQKVIIEDQGDSKFLEKQIVDKKDFRDVPDDELPVSLIDFSLKKDDNYIEIRSGMGHSNPKSILLVPLKMANTLYGVVEIASFRELEKHEIEFVEKIAENIASTIASVKINLKTANLLHESEKQSKRLEQQEEDMKLNLKELQKTQELAAKNEETALGFVNAVNHTIIRADYNLEGKLTYANSKLLESMEYSSSELKDVHYSFFMQKKDMKAFDEAWLRLSKGGSHYEEEVEYKTKFGRIWLLATYTAVRDRKGKVVKVLYLAIDISKEKGTGIGLVIVKEFVEKNKGKIEVDSKPGKGSTFSLTLPKA